MPKQSEPARENQTKARPLSAAPTRDRKSRHCITIGKTPEQVFTFFRDFTNLPKFMKDLAEIKVISATKSHWVVKLKSGIKVEWDAQITGEKPGEMISWSSVEGSEVTTSGTIWFEPAARDLGTVVQLNMDYSVPGGKLAEFLTLFLGEDPDTLVLTNLKRLKAVLETGEYPTVEGQPSGRDEIPATQLTH